MSTHRSYSSVSQLRKCGHQYKLERIDRNPRRPSVPAVAGQIIHVATEEIDLQILKGCTDRSSLLSAGELEVRRRAPALIERASEHFPPDQWKKYGAPGREQGLDWFLSTGIPNAITAYVDWRLDTLNLFQLAEVPGVGPAIEVEFLYTLPDGQRIKGYIDRVFTNPISGGYYPIDLKSGRKPDSTEQLGLYAAALRALYGHEIHWGYYLYGLKTGKATLTQPLGLTHWTEEKLESIYVPANTMIENQLFLPVIGDHCWRMCGVNHVCEFFQAATV